MSPEIVSASPTALTNLSTSGDDECQSGAEALRTPALRPVP